MSLLRHKDYLATVELDPDAGIFHGEVINTRAMLTFQGRSVDDLVEAFAGTIADYEAWCQERGKEPERPYSGSFTLPHAAGVAQALGRGCGAFRHELNVFIKD